jgi:hypothetical protein
VQGLEDGGQLQAGTAPMRMISIGMQLVKKAACYTNMEAQILMSICQDGDEKQSMVYTTD